MKARLQRLPAVMGLFGLVFLWSCATAPDPHDGGDGLPRSVTFDDETGRGRLLILRIRLESGEQVPFLFDTGTAITCLDRSLEPKLGRCVGPATVIHFGVKHEGSLYAAPRLYLGKTLLRLSGTNIATFDFRRTAPDGVLRFLGILGADVLTNYCIQLDFNEHQLRFLNSKGSAPRSWGKACPLIPGADGCLALADNFLSTTNPVSVVDSGFNYDGWLSPDCFQQWASQPPRWIQGQSGSYYGVLGGETYTALNLKEVDRRALTGLDSEQRLNGIGLRFLARHRVTFDFPNHRMYLKRTSIGPLVSHRMKKDGDAAGRSAFEYAWRLKKLGQLPGWSGTDKVANDNYSFNVTFLANPDSALEPQAESDLEPQAVVNLYNLQKTGDSSFYWYEVRRTRRTDSWEIEKAWRTDSAGRILEYLRGGPN